MKNFQFSIFNFQILAAIFLLLPGTVFAVEISIQLSHDSVAPRSEFIASVYIDTEGEDLNAYEGGVRYPTDLLELKEVRDGGSIATVWLTSPALENSDIVFSGITPGGYRGESGFLFSLVFRAKQVGRGAIRVEDILVLKNDGEGTQAASSRRDARVVVSSEAQPSSADVVDTDPPEPFELSIVETPEAFEGKRALIFVAHDKSSGIDHYEVCEGLFGHCVRAQSPHMLVRENNLFITVKAVDTRGNIRSAHLYTVLWKEQYLWYAILAILCIVGLLYIVRRMKRTIS